MRSLLLSLGMGPGSGVKMYIWTLLVGYLKFDQDWRSTRDSRPAVQFYLSQSCGVYTKTAHEPEAPRG